MPLRAAVGPGSVTLGPVQSDDPVAERRLGALLAAAREMRPERAMPPLRQPPQHAPPERAQLESRPQLRPRRAVEDDLFDDEPLTLSDVRGARR